MSKIQAELCKAAGTEPKRGEKRSAFFVRLVELVQDVPDKVWDGLSGEAQDWYNDAADAIKAKKDPAEMPDYEEEAAAPAPAPRRGAAPKLDAEYMTKVDDIATVVTSRGSFTGKVLEIDADVIVLDIDGADKEFLRSRVESITVNHGDAEDSGGPDEAAEIVKVGNELKITNKRGKVYVGKLVEIDGELLILEVDGKDEEIDKSRIETIELAAAAPAPAPAPARSSRAAAKEEPATTRRAAADAEAEKPKRASNPAGVSVGGRIRELMCADMSITADEVGKVLKEEGIEFRDTSLNMIFRETSFVFAQLKANKKLK